jgi:hypothetical protein
MHFSRPWPPWPPRRVDSFYEMWIMPLRGEVMSFDEVETRSSRSRDAGRVPTSFDWLPLTRRPTEGPQRPAITPEPKVLGRFSLFGPFRPYQRSPNLPLTHLKPHRANTGCLRSFTVIYGWESLKKLSSHCEYSRDRHGRLGRHVHLGKGRSNPIKVDLSSGGGSAVEGLVKSPSPSVIFARFGL